MLKTLIAVAALLVGIGCVSAGSAVMSTTIGIRLGLDSVPALIVSMVLTGYPLGFLLGCLYVSSAIGKVGPVQAFAAFGGLATASALGLALIDDPYVWTLMRAAAGFCSAGLYTVAESWLNSRATTATRGTVLAAYMITDKLAFSGGQGIVASGDPTGPLLFVISGLMFAFCLVPVSLSTVEAPQVGRRSRYGFRQLAQVSPLGIAASAGSGLANTAVSAAGPLYAAAIGLDTGQIALFMTMLFMGGLVLQWPIGWLSDHFDRRVILLASLIATSATSIAMAIFGTSPQTLYILGFIYGGAAFVIYPLAVGHANDLIPPDKVVAVSAGLLMAWAIGSVGGPPIASLVMGLMGPSGLFVYVAVVTSLLALFAIYRMQVRASIPNELQGKFVPLPTTSVAAKLNPRSAQVPTQPSDSQAGA